MGLDAYIYRVHNRREIQDDPDFFSKCATINSHAAWEADEDEGMVKSAELWYARKFWGLQEAVFGEGYENGEYVILEKEDIETMIDYATRHPDYFNSFSTVESLCWILYHYDDMVAKGFILLYEADW